MSYDIKLIDKNTKETLKLSKPRLATSGTYQVEYDQNTDRWYLAVQSDARINITYNYSRYYCEATENDKNFAWDDDGEISYGIRGLYGKTALESYLLLITMILRIMDKYTIDNKWITTWITTKRTKASYYKNGLEVDFHYLMTNGDEGVTVVNKEYEVSEGDTSNYWGATALNAIKPLCTMLEMASEHINNKNAIWSGD